jgi:hypothetical protein
MQTVKSMETEEKHATVKQTAEAMVETTGTDKKAKSEGNMETEESGMEQTEKTMSTRRMVGNGGDNRRESFVPKSP